MRASAGAGHCPGEALIDERQRQTLAEDGLLRLPAFLPAAIVDAARAALQRTLGRDGFWRDGTWHLPADRQGQHHAAKLARNVGKSKAVAAIFTPELERTVVALLDGASVRTLTRTPTLLFTPPNAAAWTVPHNAWHLDMPRLPTPGVPGLQAFAFLDAVPVGGGGTLVVRGSHRLLNDRGSVRSRNVKRLLKREPWFRDLMGRQAADRSRFLGAPTEVCGVPVQVAELHGEPGDVVLTDLRLLHTIAPNASNLPRLMATQRYLRPEAAAQLTAVYVADRPAVPGCCG